MKVSSSTNIDEDKYEILGLVQGVSIRSFSFFRQFMGGLRSWIGGKAEEFEEKFIETRQEALDEMMKGALKRKAHAIYAIDIDVSELSMGRSDGMIVISVSGTAVRDKSKRNLNSNKTGGKRKKTKTLKKRK